MGRPPLWQQAPLNSLKKRNLQNVSSHAIKERNTTTTQQSKYKQEQKDKIKSVTYNQGLYTPDVKPLRDREEFHVLIERLKGRFVGSLILVIGVWKCPRPVNSLKNIYCLSELFCVKENASIVGRPQKAFSVDVEAWGIPLHLDSFCLQLSAVNSLNSDWSLQVTCSIWKLPQRILVVAELVVGHAGFLELLLGKNGGVCVRLMPFLQVNYALNASP